MKDIDFVELFMILSFISALAVLGNYYKLKDNKILSYLFWIEYKGIPINNIKEIEITFVKEIGKVYVNIGKEANKFKETGYFIIMKDNSKHKIYSSFRNSEGFPLGRFIIEKYGIKHKNIKKFKLRNDYL